MLGGVDELETIPQRLGCAGLKGVIERSRSMRVQIVHDQRDLLSSVPELGDVVEKVRPVGSSAALGHPDRAPTAERFHGHEHAVDATSFVFVVMALDAAGTGRNRGPRLPDELAWRIIHADDGVLCIIEPLVDVENLFHPGHKLAASPRRYHPLLLLPRL